MKYEVHHFKSVSPLTQNMCARFWIWTSLHHCLFISQGRGFMEQSVLGKCLKIEAGEGTHAYLQGEGGEPRDGAGKLHQAWKVLLLCYGTKKLEREFSTYYFNAHLKKILKFHVYEFSQRTKWSILTPRCHVLSNKTNLSPDKDNNIKCNSPCILKRITN